MDVATDTCILINLAVVSRLDLLSLVPPFVFHAPAEVLDEIEDPEQKTAVEQGIAAGFLDVVKLEDPNELGSYVGFNAILDPNRFQIEAMVTPELDQKIDIVDSETACAYEFKVSGKNAWAEFYKDVVKVLMWNQHREKKLSCLTFIEILLPRNRDDRLLAQPGGATFRSTGTHQIALADRL